MQELIDNSKLDEKEYLKSFNKHLEEKIQERTKEINDLLKQKDEFITQLGHDLKTPISVLLNLLPMIKEDAINQTIKDDCDTALRNVKYIKNLVNETLKLAKMSSSNTSYELSDFDFTDLTKEVIDENIQYFKQNNLKITNKLDKVILVNADKLKIKEVLNNLLSNAVKYSDKDGEIIIDYKIENNKLVFSITDKGKGLNDQQLSHIFDEFYKADESRHDLESSGLGLSICKRIIQKHNQDIWAESKGVGYGSTFYFTLKLGGR